jgi:hypothetical protein
LMMAMGMTFATLTHHVQESFNVSDGCLAYKLDNIVKQ